MKIANPFERFGITQADYDGNENYGRFVIEPLERGFGLTLGNALRRVLLSSLPGASIYAVEYQALLSTLLKLKVLVMNSPLFQVSKKMSQPSS